eukprot:m.310354 g.310354  ORF g.310354 m.310354 type:complete len:433 (-) comp16476_c0_seq9:1467-2765(-)
MKILCFFVIVSVLVATCTATSVECKITQATSYVSVGDICSLPFWLNGVRYDEGTTEYNGVYSCPTHTNVFGYPMNNTWGPAECKAVDCVTEYTTHNGNITVPSGMECQFPFKFKNIYYYSCAKEIYDNNTWCAINVTEERTFDWGQWGHCNCTYHGGALPTVPPPSPGPIGPFPSPPGPPSPGPSHDPLQSDGIDPVAAGVGGTVAIIIAVIALVTLYRRNRARVDVSDLAPASYERKALLHNFRTSAQIEQNNTMYTGGSPSPTQSFTGPPKAGGGGTFGVTPPPQQSAGNPLGIPDVGSGGFNLLSMPGGGKYPGGNMGWGQNQGSVLPDATSEEWVLTEAAAAKMRSVTINKRPGDRIGLRLLNFMGRNTRGVCVVGVKPDTAGEAAGLEEGDMIVEVDGHSILNLTHDEVLQRLAAAGNNFSIIVSRG